MTKEAWCLIQDDDVELIAGDRAPEMVEESRQRLLSTCRGVRRDLDTEIDVAFRTGPTARLGAE